MTIAMIYPEDKGSHMLEIRAVPSGGFPVCNAEKKDFNYYYGAPNTEEPSQTTSSNEGRSVCLL